MSSRFCSQWSTANDDAITDTDRHRLELQAKELGECLVCQAPGYPTCGEDICLTVLAETRHSNSKGHMFSYVIDGTVVEVYRGPDGEWFAGPMSNTIDVNTGYRHGRWLGPDRWTVTDVRRYLGLDVECRQVTSDHSKTA